MRNAYCLVAKLKISRGHLGHPVYGSASSKMELCEDDDVITLIRSTLCV
jgi:hypothetical protein